MDLVLYILTVLALMAGPAFLMETCVGKILAVIAIAMIAVASVTY